MLSVAGLDPSGGAGLLADVKTLEQHKVYGLGVSTAQTLQTENQFFSIRWEEPGEVLKTVACMLEHYDVSAVKIGITDSLRALHRIVSLVQEVKPGLKTVVDPVIKSSTAFGFWQEEAESALLRDTLQKITLLTPNYGEAAQLVGIADGCKAAAALAVHCPVLLKGGHNPTELGVDYLFVQGRVEKLPGRKEKVFPKHGSGCVLSAAIVANLAQGEELKTACVKAKSYIERFLGSTEGLLGYHHV